MVVSPDSRYAYVTNQADDTVSIINPATGTATTIHIGDWSQGYVSLNQGDVLVSPDSRYAYVEASGAFGAGLVIDSTKLTFPPPEAVAPDYGTNTLENTAVTLSPMRYLLGGDTGGTITAVSTPAHGTAVFDDTTITYTPSTDYTGTDTFTYTATDGIRTDTGTVTVEVAEVVTPTPVVTVPAAPRSVTDLWENVRNLATGNDNEGLFIQLVKGADQKNRMIVYLGGTTPDWTNQSIAENVPAYVGFFKPDQIGDIDATLQLCAASTSCGSVEEIMLVGYSQGGLDAQNLAFWNGWGGVTGAENRVPVTTVVTFGSPITASGITPGVSTLHIQDDLDEIVQGVTVLTSKSPLPWPVKVVLAARQAAAVLRGEIYSGRADTAFPGVHFNPDTYRDLSLRFSQTPGDKFTEQKQNIDRFLDGQAIDPTGPNDSVAL